MKHIRNIALAMLISIFSSSYALAEFTVGISGSIANIEATGTETEGNALEKNSKNINTISGIGSVFVEMNDIMGSGITFGVDYIPFTADVSDGFSRTDTELSVTGDNDTTSTTRNQKANAELKDHLTFYAAFNPFDSALYVKAGYVTVDLETTESLATGSSYGNVDMDGVLIGAGFQGDIMGNMIGRMEVSHTSYDDISLSSSATRAGVTNATKIDADLDVTQLKASIGYKF